MHPNKENWLVSASILDGKGGATQINETDIKKWKPAKGVLWVHLNLKFDGAAEWLKNNSGLDDWTIETLTDIDESRPRTVVHRNSLLLVLRTVNLTPRSEPDDMVFLRLFADKNRLITVRLHPAIDFQSIADDFTAKEGPTDINSLIEVVLENTLDSTADTVSDLEDELDEREEVLIAKKQPDSLFADLSEMLRRLVIMHRFLSPERDALEALTRRGPTWFNEDMERAARDSFHRMQRVIEDIDLLRERVHINQDVLNSYATKQAQRNMYMLSVIATVFLPLSFLTGLFGMNVGGIPFSSDANGLLITFGLISLIGLLLLFIFRKLKWI